MEHIIQFAIGIDDKAIVERVEKNAEKQIIQSIERDVKGKIFEKDWRGEVREHAPLNDYSKRLLIDFFERNREEIIDKAADHLAERLLRTKKGKELLKKSEEEAVEAWNRRANDQKEKKKEEVKLCVTCGSGESFVDRGEVKINCKKREWSFGPYHYCEGWCEKEDA